MGGGKEYIIGQCLKRTKEGGGEGMGRGREGRGGEGREQPVHTCLKRATEAVGHASPFKFFGLTGLLSLNGKPMSSKVTCSSSRARPRTLFCSWEEMSTV